MRNGKPAQGKSEAEKSGCDCLRYDFANKMVGTTKKPTNTLSFACISYTAFLCEQ